MKTNSKFIIGIVVIVVVFGAGFYFFGAGEADSDSAAVATVDEQAGHNHGPGEQHGHDHESEGEAEAELRLAGSENLDWCAGHAVPESECTLCHPELIEDFKALGDWCAPHDLPESHCRLCNPGIEFPQERILAAGSNYRLEGDMSAAGEPLDWCAGHAVPESECTLCHPELIEEFKASGDWCGGHGIPESHCRLCNPGIEFPQERILAATADEMVEDDIEISLNFRPNAAVCATNGALIQFASASTAHRMGLSLAQVRAAALEDAIEAPAEVTFDEAEQHIVTTTIPALVSQWLVSPGDHVERKDILAILQAPEIARLQADLLKAQAAYAVQKKELERHDNLRSRNLISDADYERQEALSEQAQAELTSARGLLQSAGMTDVDISSLLDQKNISNQFPLRARTSGIVVERVAQLGEMREAGYAFARIADPEAMWIEAQLTEQQLRDVSVGQSLTFTSDGRGLKRVGAKVIWVSRFLDPHTRTGTVRAQVLDPDAGLQAGEFGVVAITQPLDQPGVLVPRDAVQWEGCCNVVFVRESDMRYRPRKVSLVGSSGDYYQVTAGVDKGDNIVVDGAFLLKTELKKSSIGAGCCALEAAG